jgi:DNA-binding PadR family transcriptional regulator
VSRADNSWAHAVLLGLLMSGPKHGYELYREIEQNLAVVWRIGLSQLYAQLKRLQESGLVVAQTELQANRPPRKMYQVTDKGREVFLYWLRQPTRYLRQLRVELLLRLYLFDRLSLSGVEQLVTAQRAVCRQQADHFAQAAVEAVGGFPQLVYEFRRGQMEAAIRWLDRCLEVRLGRLPVSQGQLKPSAPPAVGIPPEEQGDST